MSLVAHVISSVAEGFVEIINVPKLARRMRDCHALHRVLPELNHNCGRITTMLADEIHLPPSQMGVGLIWLIMDRLQTVFEKFFTHKDPLVSLWTEYKEQGDDRQYLLATYPANRTPPERGAVRNLILMNHSICGLAFRSGSDEPILVPDVTAHKELIGPYFDAYSKKARSLAVCPIRTNNNVLGVLKVESPRKGTFKSSPSLEFLLKQAASHVGMTLAIGYELEFLEKNLRALPHETVGADGEPPQSKPAPLNLQHDEPNKEGPKT